ncbi:YitT family protein [Virgibacillus sp. MSJ-26]|uniref:YitT family protein n=1 Tax=Virgibacillus sp. MSJ-26 TaxID=2841522 RepID=UPI001C11973D|nr:YitT family protein [Virgibacillus sp. MSJ-26]MBU5466790.1 YitT family protein [Virgibacillus sp. MSJ-26]
MVNKIFKNKSVKDYVYIIIGATLVGLGYNIFLLPAKIAAGGLSGVSTILFELYEWSPAYTQVIMNIPIFIVGWITLGKEFSGRTILGTFWVPFVIWLSKDIPITVTNPLLGSLYGGIILGIGLGIVYKGNGSTGGTAAIAQIVKKFTNLSSGYSQLIVDGIVVTSSLIVFNLELTLFALAAIYITSKAIDAVQLRTSATKLVMIITNKEERIQSLIKDGIDRGLTKVRSVGGYTNQSQTMILCVAEKQEAFFLRKILQEEEPNAFVIFLDASDILGRGFSLEKYYGQKL